MKVGSYDVIDRLGQGGMGIVLRARDPRGAEVAIKLLHSPDAGQASVRFAREERLLELLSADAGFVPLIDSGESAEGPWFAMPLLEGGTLRDRLARGPLGAEAATALVATLAENMGRAHARGIVHRDLKPENVLFDRKGEGARPVIADLGLAKHFRRDVPGASGSVSLSRPGSLRGTPAYMAPEQTEDAASCGPPADVFALGAILYECLTGEAAFRGESLIEIIAALRNDERPRVPVSAAPPWLARVVERCLALDPMPRFPDGAALAAALRVGPGWIRTTPRRAISVALATVLVAGALWGGARTRSGAQGDDPRDRERATRLAREALALPDSRGPSRAEAEEALVLDPTLGLAWCARGRALRLSRELDRALHDLDEAIRLDPTLAVAWSQRAAARLAKNEPRLAIADATRSVELDPGFADGWRTLGLARYHAREIDESLAAVERALELDPRLASAWTVRASIHFGRKEHALGERDAGRAIALDPMDHYAWGLRGWARHVAGEEDAAIDDSSHAIALAPDYAEWWSTRALVRAAKGDTAAAMTDFGRAIELRGGAADLHNRAYLKLKTNDLDGALADIASAVAVAPNAARYWSDLGELCFRRGRIDEAVRHDSRAIELDEKSAFYWATRGVHRMHLGQIKEAVADFSEAIAHDGALVMAWSSRAAAKGYLGDWAGAAADATRAIELDPASSYAWVWRGWARVELNDLEAGIADLERGLRGAPKAKEAWRSLGRARLARGEIDAAVAAFTKRIEVTPEEGRAYVERAGALATRGDTKEAVADLDSALKLGLAEGDAATARRRREELAAQLR